MLYCRLATLVFRQTLLQFLAPPLSLLSSPFSLCTPTAVGRVSFLSFAGLSLLQVSDGERGKGREGEGRAETVALSPSLLSLSLSLWLSVTECIRERRDKCYCAYTSLSLSLSLSHSLSRSAFVLPCLSLSDLLSSPLATSSSPVESTEAQNLLTAAPARLADNLSPCRRATATAPTTCTMTRASP